MSEDEKSKAVGAPTKYKKEYCEMLIEHMACGYTYESFAGRDEIEVHRDTLYAWEKYFPEFSDAKKVGRSKQLLRDETTLMMLTAGKFPGGSVAAHIFKMKNCHHWSDNPVKIDPEADKKEEQKNAPIEIVLAYPDDTKKAVE